MRLALCVPLLFLGLGLGGCQSSGKKDTGAAPPPRGAAGPAGPARFPTAGAKAPTGPPVDPILSSASVIGTSEASLHGRVLDPYDRPAPNATIRLVAVSEREAGGSPVDISASPEGFFTIPGLKPGVDYKLIARSKSGDRVMGGITQTTAPNVRVVIQVRDDFVGAGPADAPAERKDGKAKGASLGIPRPTTEWKPETTLDAGPKPGAVAPPLSVDSDVPAIKVPLPSATTEPKFTPGVVEAPKTWPPVLDITPKAAPGGAGAGTPLGAVRVPSCVLIGKELVNFALNDINGQPWQFRANRKGKLVLLDFWYTDCIPCRQTLPALKDLHARYAGRGLEIIGIACEKSGTPEEKAYRVHAVCSKAGITYRQLLDGGDSCPVRTQFGIRLYPTTVLVDDAGMILWRHEGLLDRATLDNLERWIQRRLPKS